MRYTLPCGTIEQGSPGQSAAETGSASERLAEGFLRLVMFVPLPFVKFVGALADHVGTHGHARTALPTRPILGGFEQARARTEAPLTFGHDEPVQFRTRANFDEVRNGDVRPAGNSRVRGFRHQQGVL